MKNQYGFFINQSLCSGCKACAMACKDKNNLDDERFFRNVTEYSGGGFAADGDLYINNVWAYWISVACNHCEKPKCVEGCPTKAMQKRENDGIVFVDQNVCIGCRYCVWNCPYHAPAFDSVKGKMSKCDFCMDLLEKGEEPACVAACPLELIQFGPIDELRKKYGLLAQVNGLPDPAVTRPNIVIKPNKNAAVKA
jgi:anaerobic dimethyl sulfoxide reductase subunit B (iron-sulfur subunit)